MEHCLKEIGLKASSMGQALCCIKAKRIRESGKLVRELSGSRIPRVRLTELL